MEQGINIRFVVSTKNGGPKDLYQLALNAGRLSCHRFVANQFRLLVHAAAY